MDKYGPWKEEPISSIVAADIENLFKDLLDILNKKGFNIIIESTEPQWKGITKGKLYRLKEKK